MKVGLLLMKHLLITLTKIVLILLGLTEAALATNAAIQKKIFGSGTTLIISDEEMNYIIEIVKYLEDSGF